MMVNPSVDSYRVIQCQITQWAKPYPFRIQWNLAYMLVLAPKPQI